MAGGLILLASVSLRGAELVVDDSDGTLGRTRAPVMVTMKLSNAERRAVSEGRLGITEVTKATGAIKAVLPVQLFAMNQAGPTTQLSWLMPPGPAGRRSFALKKTRPAIKPEMMARRDAASGQFDLTDAGQPVLRYNYATIDPGDVVAKVDPANRIYAQARSDYIHPLFGLNGETLTQDWSVDHPHHRGIYWAWPEVDWRGQRGDLHALQHVFARPTGECKVTSGPVFAQIEAENVWQWESGESLVHERAIIRAYHATGDDRLIDLEFQFTALNEPVLLARRGTDKYGGLNIRLAKVADQEISFHTDATNDQPRMAWAELSGKFSATAQPSSLVVLQHRANPDYPGDWVKFPESELVSTHVPGERHALRVKEGRAAGLAFPALAASWRESRRRELRGALARLPRGNRANLIFQAAEGHETSKLIMKNEKRHLHASRIHPESRDDYRAGLCSAAPGIRGAIENRRASRRPTAAFTSA